MGPRLKPRASKGACFAGSSVVPSGFGENLIKQGGNIKDRPMAHFLEEIFELGSAHPAQLLNF